MAQAPVCMLQPPHPCPFARVMGVRRAHSRHSPWRVAAPVGAAACCLLSARLALAWQPQPYINLPCSTYTCPSGYFHRWDADATLCAEGACTQNDTDACCVQGRFFSHSWRVVVASNVSIAWEVHRLRFFLDENCSTESVAPTVPGTNHKWRDWPNGAAFSHHHGHGSIAARAFVADPTATARDPAPQRKGWSSVGPCQEGACFLGFKWESDIDRYPRGSCHSHFGAPCASEGQLHKAGFLRIACAEVEQGQTEGRYADALQLQLLDAHMPQGAIQGAAAWRTAAEVRGLQGGTAQVRMAVA
uniref:Uncharacterized protein n=1 Tax=Alexandrium monilatum TaxID=311494 RepID=A0A7S4V2L4_9DINO